MRDSKYTIYCLIDPRNDLPKYIGKAKVLSKRLNGHYKHEINQKHKRACWLKSLKSQGLEAKVEILDQVNLGEENFWEQYYISLYRSWGFQLLNSTNGGDGGATRKGCIQSEDERRKRVATRLANDGFVVTQEHKNKISQGLKGNQNHLGYTHSEETKEQIRKKKLDQVTPEFREKMRLINLGNQNRKGKQMSQESKSKLQRPIVQKDLNGNIIAKFNGIAEAVRTTGIKGIANCLTGRASTAGKYRWEYAV